MKVWKKYLTGILALALVVGMVSLLPRIHGEEFDEDEYTFSEETADPEIEDVPEPEVLPADVDEPEEPEEPEEPDESEESEEPNEPEEPEEPEESEENPFDGKLDGGLGDIEAGPMQPALLTLTPRELTASEAALTVELELGMCERQCTIANAEGKTLQIRNCRITDGDMEYEKAGFVIGSDRWFYDLNASSCYLLTGNFGNDGSVRIRFAFGDDLYVGFKGTGIQTVLVTPDGISVQGSNMDCQLFRNEAGTDHKVVMNVTNANQAVLLYENGGFKGWSDGAYALQVIDVYNLSNVLSSVNAAANSVYSISNVSSDSPLFALVEETE